MAKHDVTKTPFSQKFLRGFFQNFGRKRQIDAGEGTVSFTSISVAVFELTRKPGRGVIFAPSGAGLKCCLTRARVAVSDTFALVRGGGG